MTHTTEQINERFDEKFGDRTVGAVLNRFSDERVYPDILSFIHTIREEDRAEMVKMIEEVRKEYLGNNIKFKMNAHERGYSVAIDDILFILFSLGITKKQI